MIDINLPNYLYYLDEDIKIYDFNHKLKEIHKKSGKTIRAVSNELGVHVVTCSLYISGKNRPSLKILKKLSSIYGVDLLKIAFNENYIFIIKKKITSLPRKLTNDLAYYIGYLQGDGYLESDKKSFGFVDEYKEQIEKIQNLTEILFGIKGVIRPQFSRCATKPCWVLNVNSYIVNSFIHNFFGIVRGPKEERLMIPDILKSNKVYLPIYLSGLYDADGTLPKNPKIAKQLFVDITMKNKTFIIQIKSVLTDLGIDSLKIYPKRTKSGFCDVNSVSWEIRIRNKKVILSFLNKIGFRHPNKIRRQKELILFLS